MSTPSAASASISTTTKLAPQRPTAASRAKPADATGSENSSSTSTSAPSVPDSKASSSSTTSSATEAGETVITPDPEDHSIRHPLQCRWTLWYKGKQDAAGGWGNFKPVMSFDTVEDFWSLFNNIKPPSTLPVRWDFYLFKEGIRPEWEDKSNAGGGSWTIELDGKMTAPLDKAWLYTCLAMIGEQFEDSDLICGVAVMKRQKRNRLQMWTKKASDEDAQLRIGRTFKSVSELLSRFAFQSHADAMEGSKRSSYGPKDTLQV